MTYRKRNRPYQMINNDSEALVLAGDKTSIITLNNTAFVIWQRCDGCGIEELVNRVMQVCNLSPEQYYTTVKNDCEDILSYLLENELIKEENV